MSLSSVHLLLTYKCDGECDHCFVWSSPGSAGTMSLEQIDKILSQARGIPSVTRIYFEGGEPFLFYPVLVKGIEHARSLGFEVGIVSNAYWATDKKDCLRWLEPLAKQGIADLTLSTDELHGEGEPEMNVKRAKAAAKELGVPIGIISLRGIEFYSCPDRGTSVLGEIYFRGRAAVKLAPKARGVPWRTLERCPEEPPGITRVHVDSSGNVQFCQGITIGNVWRKPLRSIMEGLDPERHPIIGPLIRGGPAQLSRERGVRPRKEYADACHLCYEVRCALRKRARFPGTLVPDQVYGADAGDRE